METQKDLKRLGGENEKLKRKTWETDAASAKVHETLYIEKEQFRQCGKIKNSKEKMRLRR